MALPGTLTDAAWAVAVAVASAARAAFNFVVRDLISVLASDKVVVISVIWACNLSTLTWLASNCCWDFCPSFASCL